ncbi:MAG: hypothetical protein ACP5MB_06350 [bacterium]
MTTYTGTVQGIPVTSNYPLNASVPHGSYLYTITLNFSNPYAEALAAAGIEAEAFLDPAALTKKLKAETGASNISNVKILTPNGKQIVITFNASSPQIILVLGVILVLIAVIAYLINSIVVNLTNLAQSGGGFVLDVIALTGLVIAGVIAFALIYWGYNKISEKREAKRRYQADVDATIAAQRRADYLARLKADAAAKMEKEGKKHWIL